MSTIKSTADSDLPRIASLMAADFHNLWWSSDSYKGSREKNKDRLKDMTSALRIEICNYITSISMNNLMASSFGHEIELLSKLNVDGIITTNWDTLVEKLFPDYRVFIGQSELLFSNPQSIAEIYKIHGSASKPSSLVLTSDDYLKFEERNPYLAAKLITLFVEHPIVFIGYSLTDRNINQLLRSIIAVLGKDRLNSLRDNLIFIQRSKSKNHNISKTFMTIDGGQIPITIVSTDDFAPVYEALDEVKRKIPARILRYCKEQLYELVKSSSPDSKLCVVDVDQIESKDDIEFVVGVGVGVGVGVATAAKTAQVGYQGITILDLFKDLIEDHNLDPRQVLEKTMPAVGKAATYIPIFKHLSLAGINSDSLYTQSNLELQKHYPSNGATFYRSNAYARQFVQSEKGKSAQQIIESNPVNKAAIFLAFLPKNDFDLDIIKNFLLNNIEHLESANTSYATFFRKLACLYDYYRYGWDSN